MLTDLAGIMDAINGDGDAIMVGAIFEDLHNRLEELHARDKTDLLRDLSSELKLAADAFATMVRNEFMLRVKQHLMVDPVDRASVFPKDGTDTVTCIFADVGDGFTTLARFGVSSPTFPQLCVTVLLVSASGCQ